MSELFFPRGFRPLTFPSYEAASFSFCLSLALFFYMPIWMSDGHLLKCLNSDYNNKLDTDASLHCLVSRQPKSSERKLEIQFNNIRN